MTSRVRHGGRFSLLAALVAFGLWALPSSPAMAHGGGGGGGGGHGGGGFGGGHMGGMGMGGMGMGGMGMGGMGMGGMGMGRFGGAGFGRFGGFGGFGFFPGFWGGGLGWGFPYYGYGLGYPYYGYGLGYGGLGYGGLGYGGLGYGMGYGGYGYPYYGGNVNPYYGGYGYPSYGYGGGYGYGNPYYANAYGSPNVGVTYTSAYVAPSGSAANMVMPGQRRYLGIDEDPTSLSDGRRGMQVTNVYPGTAAQRAGLQTGDVLLSINGYLTEQRGNLAWIIANATPNNQLKITLKRAGAAQQQTVTAMLP
jgi:PDZ domain